MDPPIRLEAQEPPLRKRSPKTDSPRQAARAIAAARRAIHTCRTWAEAKAKPEPLVRVWPGGRLCREGCCCQHEHRKRSGSFHTVSSVLGFHPALQGYVGACSRATHDP